ncbi:MAG: NADP-dependent oxidoreductase [Chitinophagaceae bacterium]|nr:NADP-dependent oxidoreductase [Chitinophagaceae bacterium]
MDNRQIVLASRPTGVPDDTNFRIETVSLPEPGNGQILLAQKYLSVDPYMRWRLSDFKSYSAPYDLDEPISGLGLAQVVESNSPHLKKGDWVKGLFPWAEYVIAHTDALTKIDDKIGVPVYRYLDVLGFVGYTAYCGLTTLGKPKPGETVVVSGAAGAVGLLVGQIAKIYGCNVLGIAGTNEKINLLLNEYDFDEAINYKTSENISQELAEKLPQGIDVYFDNVGGEITDAVFENINTNARILICGQISQYNDDKPEMGPRFLPVVLKKTATISGFLASQFAHQFGEAGKKLTQWILEGKLKYTETIVEGFDQIPNAFLGLFSGRNTGKMIVKI